MHIDEFDYPLPSHLIADRPLPKRSDSRLMLVDRKEGTVSHHRFTDLPDLLDRGDLLVFNDSKVIPARLLGKKRGGGARIEILLLEEKGPLTWEAIAQRAVRLRAGTIVDFEEGSSCEVTKDLGQGRFLFRFHPKGKSWNEFLEEQGEIPLPPYIEKKRAALPEELVEELERIDRERYQTTFAEKPGSAAAPTAGLHFDEEILARLEGAGIRRKVVTLHVGLDTFAPVVVDRIEDHRMKTEWCFCPAETVIALEEAEKRGHRVVAVGTTTCRTLETYARRNWPESPIRSDLFLKPGDSFMAVNALLTNFHLPKTTLLMLVSAFMGNDLRRKAYEEAIRMGYRFYSYGDAMLIV